MGTRHTTFTRKILSKIVLSKNHARLFSIFSKGGILLWCFRGIGLDEKDWAAFTPAVNAFIKTVLLQEKTDKKGVYENGSLALKYKLDNEFELVFVVGYQKMLPLLYLDKLLDEIQLRFRDRFGDDLTEKNFYGADTFANFSEEFRATLSLVEKRSKEAAEAKKSEMRDWKMSSKSQKTVASMVVDKNSNTTSNGKKASSEPSKVTPEEAETTKADLDEETRLANLSKLAAKKKKGPAPFTPKSPKMNKTPKAGKVKTKWDPFTFNGKGPEGAEAAALDRTSKIQGPNAATEQDLQFHQYVPNTDVIGNSADLRPMAEEDDDDERDETMLESDGVKAKDGFWSSLSSLVGSKQLTMSDIEPVISKMKDHLISKNVASEVADKLCQSVASKLEGKVLGTFSTVHRTVKETLVESLVQLLTPKRRIGIIRDVLEAKSNKHPYVITFCGVNGVGKSTNLAKICFWLLENKCSVLVAACDTFRAGAVEQLRTHVKRLNSLYPAHQQADNKAVVELYEKGYGKDAAGIAMEAINYARSARLDVVLVDTAGRMQDNEPLMRSLSKLISVNAPDLVLFVGEALVGNEAVDQLVKFNAALADHSSQSQPHLIDGIVLTKFDTIDDKVGSAISMTYISGQPIVFVGSGQTYTDLKALNAKSVVQLLMK